jgi:hypothetical protein
MKRFAVEMLISVALLVGSCLVLAVALVGWFYFTGID